MGAHISREAWEIPAIFQHMQRAGQVADAEMFRAFNMGVGMIVVADPADVEALVASARAAGVRAWRVGHVRPGGGAVVLEGENPDP